MNREKRRAGRIKAPGPQGGYLYPELLFIMARDAKGRPTELRWAHDDETIGEVVGEDQKPELLLVYVGEAAGFRS